MDMLNKPIVDAHDCDLTYEFSAACAHALKRARSEHGLSRERVVDELNALLPNSIKKIKLHTLEAWISPDKPNSFPAQHLAAFCRATGCDEPLRVQATAAGFNLIGEREQAILELAEIAEQEKQLAERKAAIAAKI